jgi:hypothetical protein
MGNFTWRQVPRVSETLLSKRTPPKLRFLDFAGTTLSDSTVSIFFVTISPIKSTRRNCRLLGEYKAMLFLP